MNKRHVLLIILIFIFQTFPASALAMSSAHYKLDWFTPLTGNGGGAMSSAHYGINVTVGQSVTGVAESNGYRVRLGYWAGLTVPPIYFPLILRN